MDLFQAIQYNLASFIDLRHSDLRPLDVLFPDFDYSAFRFGSRLLLLMRPELPRTPAARTPFLRGGLRSYLR